MLHPRARTMLILSVPAILIGIACSLILIVAMKVAALLQRVLWSNLPAQLGVSADSPLWIIAMLTATGIAVGLVIRYSPGHAGPDPATESLIGAPIATGALPGLTAALILGLAGGVSLGGASDYGGEYRAGCRCRLPTVSARQLAGLDHPRGLRHHRRPLRYPGCRRADFSQTLNSSNDTPLWDRLFAPLLAAAAGALTTGLFFHPHFSLPIRTMVRCASLIFSAALSSP